MSTMRVPSTVGGAVVKAETNGYTQLCDKCHRLMRGSDAHRVELSGERPYDLYFAWYGEKGRWINQVCGKCKLALRLEGVL